MEHSQSVDFNVFYDPSLALHLSRGWKLSQMLQGRVATLTSNRFIVKVNPFSRPATENAKGPVESDPSSPGGGNGHCGVGVLDGMTVCDLKKIVVTEYNTKAKAHHDITSLIDVASGCETQPANGVEAQNKSSQSSTTENNPSSSGAFAPINEDLATLSWGSALLAPEETLLSEFGLSDAHQGATLVLETYASWADKLNAMTFAIADKKTRAELSEIVVPSADEVDQCCEKNVPRDSTVATNQKQERIKKQQAASDGRTQEGSYTKKPEDSGCHYPQDSNTPKMSEEAKREETLREGSNAIHSVDPSSRSRSGSSTPSFTSSSDDEDAENGAAADVKKKAIRESGEKNHSDGLNLNETFVKGRPADRGAILRALEARLSKVQVGQ